MPTKGRSQIKSYVTPLIADVLFFQIEDLDQERWANLNYEDPHPDGDRWPHHRLVHLQPLPDQGDHVYALFYAADRKHQDRYNFEHRKANLGGSRFDTVVRSYVVRRETYDPKTPALGTRMPDVPVGKFADSAGVVQYELIGRDQDRISQRSARAQSTIGQAELDSTYVVETRTYIDREEIISNVAADETIGGLPLFTRQNIYLRGESYSNALNGTPVTIQAAAADGSYWGVTDGGQKISFTQVSDDVWIETVQDVIPQSGLPSDAALFGGTVLRVYETSMSYPWPAVLGSDGVPEYLGTDAVEVMDWVTKSNATRNYVRPRYKRSAKRVKTRAEIHQEWLTQTEMDSAGGSDGLLDIITEINPKPVYYPSPLLTVNLPPALHQGGTLVADTGSNDPFWGQNAGSTRSYPATDITDWPNYIIADVSVQPFRGGYLVTQVKIYKPKS